MKRIKLISTGGTISCRASENGLTPALKSDELLSIAGISSTDISCFDLFQMDSSNVQPEEWANMATAIRDAAHTCDAVVLTHGTDTMAYTASMLSFMLYDIKIPVVITGSQKPLEFTGSDGVKNLRDAVIAARELPCGVYICFGGDVLLGCRAVKTHTLSARAFESVNFPAIGTVSNEVFTPNEKCARLCDAYPDYITPNADIDPRVALIKLIPGASPSIITSLINCDVAGVVIESFGLGGVHNFRRDHNKAILSLMDAGIAVVMTSQCLYEGAALDTYAVSRTLFNAGVISAHDMTTEACVTKLMWALGQAKASGISDKRSKFERVKALMRLNVCTEKSADV